MFKSNLTRMALVSLCFLSACTAVKAPNGQVPRRIDLPKDAFGGWINLTLTTNEKLEGELLAVSTDSIYVLHKTLTSIARSSARECRLVMYNTDVERFSKWTTWGTLSTLSHGFFLIITAPVWLIVGSTTTLAETHRINYLDYPGASWEYISRFSRFPQGIPPGLDRRSLQPREIEK